MRKIARYLKPTFFSSRLYIALIAVALLSVATQKAFMQKSSPPGDTGSLGAAESLGKGLPTRPGSDTKGEQPPAGKQDPMIPQIINDTANYTFATATDGSLTDMSSGTTQLLAANIDDTASALTNIGFDFYFQIARFTQFSINDNGVLRLGAAAQTGSPYQPLAQLNLPLITAYGADQRTHTTGKVHFKVTGSAPNRVLIIEWLNMQSNFSAGGTADLTYQVRLFETTGVIEFVYGSMTMSAAGAADGNSNDPHIGFSSSNVANTVGSVTAAQSGTPAPTFNGASNDPVENLYVAGSITVLSSATDGTRRRFTFTPPTPTAPTSLTFTGVTAAAMTLNWVDSADEKLYAIYRSTDGTNFTFNGTAAQNATSFNATGLNPSTTYFWQVFSVSEGALSTALTGSQMTAAAGNIQSTAAGGNWSSTATWVGGVVPTTTDNVTIVDGSTVTIDVTTATCLNLTVGQGTSGILQYITTPASTLTVINDVTVATGGTFTAGTGTLTTHILNIGGSTNTSASTGSLTDNGTFDMNTTAGVTTNFFGTSDGTVSGNGATCDFFAIVMQKGTNQTPVLDVTRIITTNVPAASANRLSATNGTFKLSSASVLTPWFGSQTLTAATGRIWLNNAGASTNVVGIGTGTGAGSPTVNGTLQVDAGTFGYGSGNNTLTIGAAGALIIGGANATVNIFGAASFTAGCTFTQTAGNFNINPQAANALGATVNVLRFNTMTVNFTGGTLTIVNPHNATSTTGKELSISTSNAALMNFQGGTIRFGDGVSSLAGSVDGFEVDTFVSTQQPFLGNVIIDNPTTNAATRFFRANTALAPLQFLMNGTLTVTNTGGSAFRLNGNLCAFGGNIVNNGTIDGTVAGSRLYFLGNGVAQTYSGTGTVTTPLTQMDFDNPLGVTFDPGVSQIIVGSRINLFRGTSTNSNKLTIGNAGATQKDVQYGVAAGVVPGGNFDQAPVFNLGTGNYVVTYAQESVPRTTAFEIPSPSNTVTNVTVNNTNGVILGGNINITGTLTLTNGNVTTNANTLSIGAAGTVARTSGHVIGNFKKTYSAVANKTFEVGTANGFSPVGVNVTAGTFPSDLTVKAVQGPQPNILSPTHALQRYWTLTESGDITADLTFNYLDPIDIPGTANEGLFVILKYDGAFTMPGGTVTPATNQATITGVTSFSDWTLAEPGAPTDVHLLSFSADRFDAQTNSPGGGGVLLRWQTGFEVANLGFNLYRDEAGKRIPVSPGLIAGSALFVGSGTALGAGRSYAWVDKSAQGNGGPYWLEEVSLNGLSSWHGPVFASSNLGIKSLSAYNIQPSRLITDLGNTDSQTNLSAPVERKAKISRLASAQVAQQGALASQAAIKISVKQEGWYKLTQPELVAAGLNPGVDARLLQLFVDGQEQAINVVGAKDAEFGTGAAVEFYGLGLDTPSTDTRVYWLVAGTTPGKRIAQVKEQGVAAVATSFPFTVERKDRVVYFASLRNGDKENFFGPVITSNPVDQSVTVTRLDPTGGQAQLEVRVQGVTTAAHQVRVQVNGTNVGFVSFNGQAEGTGKFSVAGSLLREGQNQIALTAMGSTNDISLAGSVRLTYSHSYQADDNTLRLTGQGNQAVTIGGFTGGQIRVVDVSNAAASQELIGQVRQDKGSYSVTVTPVGAGARQLLAFLDQGRKPARIEANVPSSWRDPANGADVVMITRRELMTSLEPLKSLRQSQRMKVAVIDVYDLLDEFSSGQRTPQAVKDFLAYAASSWKVAPRYVLLAGDSSLDPRDYLGQGDSDLVPTKLIDTSFMETESDAWMVDFNNDGLEDMAIGRLPVRTPQQTAAMVSKIVAYESTTGAEGVLLVSDSVDGEVYNFEQASTQLQVLIPPNVRVERIDRGRMDPAEAKAMLLEILNRGPKLVNYIGHGTVDLWRGNLLTTADVLELTNGQNLPLYITMTCLNGYSIDPTLDSLAEALMKREQGGAVAVWASSGMTMPEGQGIMNREMYRQIFSGLPQTLGEATRRAKMGVSDVDVRRTWILFGDPSSKLR